MDQSAEFGRAVEPADGDTPACGLISGEQGPAHISRAGTGHLDRPCRHARASADWSGLSMAKIDRLTSGEDTFEAVLIGGPADIPMAARTVRAAATETKIKLRHRNGYEHFEIVSDPDGRRAERAIFRWTMRTKIAE
ncbi:DUF5988 family protein [Actinoallomurus oryzae]|jgi:hypothetical protein